MTTTKMRNTSQHYADTTIGSSSMLVGVLTSEGNIHIDGVFEGEILAAQHIKIGNTGRVRAMLNAIACTINGSLVGNIRVHQAVVIQSSARVWGEIDAQSLQIEPGAVFKGVANGSEGDEVFKI